MFSLKNRHLNLKVGDFCRSKRISRSTMFPEHKVRETPPFHILVQHDFRVP